VVSSSGTRLFFVVIILARHERHGYDLSSSILHLSWPYSTLHHHLPINHSLPIEQHFPPINSPKLQSLPPSLSPLSPNLFCRYVLTSIHIEYAKVTKMLGDCRCEVFCYDGKDRSAEIRGGLRNRIFINVVSIGIALYQSDGGGGG